MSFPALQPIMPNRPRLLAGKFYDWCSLSHPGDGRQPSIAYANLVTANDYWSWFTVPNTVTADRFGVDIATNGDANTKCRIVLAYDDGTSGPGTIYERWSDGELRLDGGGTGAAQPYHSKDVLLIAGVVYHVGFNRSADAGATVRLYGWDTPVSAPPQGFAVTDRGNTGSITVARAYAAFPATATAPTAISGVMPRVWFRVKP